MARHAALDRRIGVRIPGGQFHFLKGRKFLLLLSNTYGLLFYFRFLSLKFTSAHSRLRRLFYLSSRLSASYSEQLSPLVDAMP